jgi:hypothetical protein
MLVQTGAPTAPCHDVLLLSAALNFTENCYFDCAVLVVCLLNIPNKS